MKDHRAIAEALDVAVAAQRDFERVAQARIEAFDRANVAGASWREIAAAVGLPFATAYRVVARTRSRPNTSPP